EEAPEEQVGEVRRLRGLAALLRGEGSEGGSGEPREDADRPGSRLGRPGRARGSDAAAPDPRGLRMRAAAAVPAPGGPIIRLAEVHKVYDSGENAVHALRGIDLDVESGEYMALMGPSGSGKSTLMHIVGCLDVPSAGEYFLDGIPVSGMS